MDIYNTPFFHLEAVDRWLGVRIDVLGSGVSLACSTFVVCRTGAGRMDAGAAGLAMSYAATFTGNLPWLIRLYTANEQDMNSMERVGEYLDVPQEGPAAVPARTCVQCHCGSCERRLSWCPKVSEAKTQLWRVREPLVLLMDESTASLDANTAARIQDNLRAQTCTTITIAHRLPSIIDCDRVVSKHAAPSRWAAHASCWPCPAACSPPFGKSSTRQVV